VESGRRPAGLTLPGAGIHRRSKLVLKVIAMKRKVSYIIYNEIFIREVKTMATKSKAKAKKITVYRSSDTGKFVSSAYAKKHPKTTFKQSVAAPIAKKK
jgi:hypothetical protein